MIVRSVTLFLLITSLFLVDAEAGTIQVSFTNRSGYEVGYYLSGGGGVEARIENGKTKSWDVTVDPGEAPFVRIHQVNGKSLEFSLQHGGNYQFIVKNGKIVNAENN